MSPLKFSFSALAPPAVKPIGYLHSKPEATPKIEETPPDILFWPLWLPLLSEIFAVLTPLIEVWGFIGEAPPSREGFIYADRKGACAETEG